MVRLVVAPVPPTRARTYVVSPVVAHAHEDSGWPTAAAAAAAAAAAVLVCLTKELIRRSAKRGAYCPSLTLRNHSSTSVPGGRPYLHRMSTPTTQYLKPDGDGELSR